MTQWDKVAGIANFLKGSCISNRNARDDHKFGTINICQESELAAKATT